MKRVAFLPLFVLACGGPTPAPEPPRVVEVQPQPVATTPAPQPAQPEPPADPAPRPAPQKVDGDLFRDKPFTLADATEGMPPDTGRLVATITTSEGELICGLFPDKAPIAVANFVGLARGTRPWRSKDGWVKAPAYDGTTFHRVIKGFMIQGGDSAGNGTGEPGYVFKDEIWPGAKHDRAGLLCMANRGPNTNGAQFFITDAAAPHLDRSYTIFGECEPVSVVHAIASVPTGPSDRPRTPVTIDKVAIFRGKP